jgi:thiol-disulfide isomerase/thioredoxin
MKSWIVKSAELGALALAVCLIGCTNAKEQPRTQRAEETHGSGNAQGQEEVIRFVKNPEPAPAFALKDLEGKPLSLEEAKGKVVLLNFWATWCGPCRAEIPDLIELQKEFKDKLEIIALATDEDDAEEVKKFVAKEGINYPVAMDDDKVSGEYGGVPALPTSFVIDPQGRVVEKHVGLNDPSIYELEVRALLGQQVNAKVEYFEDTGQIFLTNAKRATELPGVDMSKLTPEQKKVALHRLNAESCTCGCNLTLAQCRINDTGCDTSQSLAEKIVAEVSGKGRIPGKPAGNTTQDKMKQ